MDSCVRYSCTVICRITGEACIYRDGRGTFTVYYSFTDFRRIYGPQMRVSMFLQCLKSNCLDQWHEAAIDLMRRGFGQLGRFVCRIM